MKTAVFSAILIALTTQVLAQDGQVTVQQDPKINELVKLYTKGMESPWELNFQFS